MSQLQHFNGAQFHRASSLPSHVTDRWIFWEYVCGVLVIENDSSSKLETADNLN